MLGLVLLGDGVVGEEDLRRALRIKAEESIYDLFLWPEGRFEFKNVPAGTYKLTNRIAGEPLWRLKVDVADGQTASVDLTPQNSLRVRDDFPDGQ